MSPATRETRLRELFEQNSHRVLAYATRSLFVTTSVPTFEIVDAVPAAVRTAAVRQK